MSYLKTHAEYSISPMKKVIDGVLIVEGKSDVSYLSQYVDTLFFITNGYDLNDEKIDFLSRASKVNKLIILTDPDEAGEEIRNKLKSKINGIFDAKIEKDVRKSYKKTGVAEARIENVMKTLEPYIVSEAINRDNYDLMSLISLSENPEAKRQQIIDKYRLIKGNNKSLENQLRILKISKEELWK